ncbi:unnamed protein product [Rangifer tarandus platyrhynchus]|uniref:Uncharacterized protein n=1 Tax=Rangifer tarandus platyrhynchus TaxID=3082113 RepID=A0ABN8ZDE8_RANTA|nr:unnamed protein product [Rangifer tarandus platyrhynchus]
MFENKRNKLGKRWLGRPCSACLHLRPIKAEAFAVLAGPSLEITRGRGDAAAPRETPGKQAEAAVRCARSRPEGHLRQPGGGWGERASGLQEKGAHSAVFPPERLERSLTQEASVWLSDGSETPVCVPSMQFL